MNSDGLVEELTCPITHELLRDPITLPCCGKVASREALKEAVRFSQNCPMCRRPSVDEQFVVDAPCNRVVQALLDALASGASQAFREQSGDTATVAADTPKLSAFYSVLPVPSSTETREKIARLTLQVTNAANVGLRRVLCILVVDQSYSMYGSPWAQASLAMRHVVAMSREAHIRRHVTLRIVTYNSRSYELDCGLSSSLETVYGRISTIKPGYGTSFRGAFAGTMDVMSKTVADAQTAMERNPSLNEGGVGPMPHNVSVVFMTDGQASESREGLAQELKTQILQFCHRVPDVQVTVHAVGFSNDCDKVLLQQIRDAGTHPGQFRYCEPGDSEDALCGRITGMFESIAAHGGCDVVVERLLGLPRDDEDAEGRETAPTWEFLDDDGCVLPADRAGKVKVALRTKPDGVGTAVAWLSIRNADDGDVPVLEQEASQFVLPLSVTCNASQDSHLTAEETDSGVGETIPKASTRRPDWTVAAMENTSFAAVDSVKRAWVGVRLHVIAEDAISLLTRARDPNSSGPPEEAVRLEAAFLENRVRAVSTVGSDAHKRVPALLEQLQGLAAWGLPGGQASVVNLGRLRDLSSASAFSSARAPIASAGNISAASSSTQQQKEQPAGENVPASSTESEPPVTYSCSAAGRNELQNALMEWGQAFGADSVARRVIDALETTEQREAVVEEADPSGNTAVHLAAYHGQFDAITVLLETSPSFDVDMPNNFGETPITIAIKRRGYHKSVETLQTFGGSIPADRVDALIQFCARRDYTRTAAYLRQRVRDGMLGLSETKGWKLMSNADLPLLVFEQETSSIAVKSRLGVALRQGRSVDWASLVMMGLRLTQKEFVEQGLEHVTAAQIEPSWVFADCFPRKPDALDTANFLDLLGCMLDFAPDLIGATLPETGETLLHRAVTAGSLPHVEYLVTKGISPEVQDLTGNTPLHVSCLKKYPCIVDSFITAGADINLPNNNGCTPVSFAVQMGSLRIVETLVGSGAMLDGPLATNDAGDNLLHTAVQNNHPNILSLLLDRVSPETMLEVDSGGFSPILAAVSKDRKECLNILLDAAAGFMQFGIPGFSAESGIESETTSKLPILERKTPKEFSVIPQATALHVAVHFGQSHALTTLLTRGANPNSLDGHGLTPLHRAAQRGDATAVFTLVAQGASCSAVDGNGRTPASYGRSHPSVMAALVGPVPGPLFAFAAGNMSEAAVVACSGVVGRAKIVAAEPGLFSSTRILESPLDDLGQTALMVASSHGNAVAAQALFKAGSSPTREDQRGLSASAWAQMVKSNRLLGALGVRPFPLLPAPQRLVDACRQWGTSDSLTVFLGGKREKSWPGPSMATSLHHRLVLLAEQFQDGLPDASTVPMSIALLSSAPRTGTIDRVTIASPGSCHQRSLDVDRWASKISAAGAVASAKSPFRPKHVFSAHLATRHGPLVPKLNSFLSTATAPIVSMPDKTLLDFAVALSDMLKETPSAAEAARENEVAEEVYSIAPPGFDRKALLEGKEITTAGFSSATTDWSVCLASLSRSHGGDTAAFGSGNGVVLVISVRPTASCARAVWTVSSCTEDREVMFPPGSKFRVEGWYKGDIQVFGSKGKDDRFRLEPAAIDSALKEEAGSLVVRLAEVV